jgi:hypothetical protein
VFVFQDHRMAITIAANLAKKVPIPGSDFSSQQASITITAEVSDLNQVPAEAQKLYQLAEQAVDAQLRGGAITAPEASPPASRASTPPAAIRPTPPPSRSSAPYRGGGSQRRGPAPITESQIRFLNQLIERNGYNHDAICDRLQVQGFQELSCKAAAELIDELKSGASAGGRG